MALPNELHPLQLGAGSASAYQIEQSLRFDGSSYLNWTSPASAGDRQTWTLSFWHKRSEIGTGTLAGYQTVLAAPSGSGDDAVRFDTSNKFKWFVNDTGAGYLDTTALYRDFSAWSHYVVVADYSNSTASERVRMFINGERITDTSYSAPSTSFQGGINNSVAQVIGIRYTGSTYYLKGYLAEFHFIDGTAKSDASDFGEYDTSGVWRPIEYTGTYGTNGYYLKFDPTAANGIGHDHSGNGNNFNPNGFVTTGTGTDVMSDTPTTNWCTLNPVGSTAASQCSNGNLQYYNGTTSSWRSGVSSFAVSSGKWYFEAKFTSFPASSGAFVGVGRDTIQWVNNVSHFGQSSVPGSYGYYSGNGNIYDGSGAPTYGSTYSTNDLIGCALDLDAGTLHFYKNGVDQGEAASGLTGTWNFGVSSLDSPAVVNFGQREFLYPPGTASATSYFNTVLYTGNNSTNAITGVGFAPDLVWIKPRSTADHHRLNDTLRGVNKTISSNLQNPEYGPVNAYLDSFDSDGFTVSTSDLGWNNSSHTYVAWCWNAGGTTAGNTDGTITSSIRANQDAGFSIVTWSGSNVDATVGHGLGTTPGLIFFKRLNNTTSWAVYHSSLGANNIVYLNETAASSSSGTSFGSTPTAPTSTVFSVGDNGGTNYGTMIAYCWAEKPGVTKIGSYEGNGLASGLSVDVGFKPAMVIIKNADAVDDWNIIDNRTPPNANLRPNSTSAEDSAVTCYLTPTGFTVATGNSHRINFANETFIYIAFAENFSADATYKALNTANLPAPTVKDGSDYFNTVLWTGNSTANRDITGVGFNPDFTWLKERSGVNQHELYDAVRGAAKRLQSNDTAAEDTVTNNLSSFITDGFRLGTAGSVNNLNDTYVAWNWLAGNGTSTNTDGSITSTVSANPSAGFSIVSYTGNNTAGATVGHGLGVAPNMVIVKNRTDVDNWKVYHSALGNTKGLDLNRSAAFATQTELWNDTSPTSTVFSLGTNNALNGSSDDMIAYCFAEVEGYSKFGSYTGNGSLDGVFNYCGFRPSWLLVRRTNVAADWHLVDSTRSPYNLTNTILLPDLSDQETTYTNGGVDLLSNGFKIRSTGQAFNNSGDSYIFAVFAENPFGGSGVNPATAR